MYLSGSDGFRSKAQPKSHFTELRREGVLIRRYNLGETMADAWIFSRAFPRGRILSGTKRRSSIPPLEYMSSPLVFRSPERRFLSQSLTPAAVFVSNQSIAEPLVTPLATLLLPREH